MKFQGRAKLTCVRESTVASSRRKTKKTCVVASVVAPLSAPWADRHLRPNRYCLPPPSSIQTHSRSSFCMTSVSPELKMCLNVDVVDVCCSAHPQLQKRGRNREALTRREVSKPQVCPPPLAPVSLSCVVVCCSRASLSCFKRRRLFLSNPSPSRGLDFLFYLPPPCVCLSLCRVGDDVDSVGPVASVW